MLFMFFFNILCCNCLQFLALHLSVYDMCVTYLHTDVIVLVIINIFNYMLHYHY